MDYDPCKVRRVARFVRNLRGGAQSSLIVADDNALYALKFDDNPQGQNLLFNEALGSELYRMVGLPTADWTPIYVDDEFLNSNPSAWFQHESGKRRPRAGLHFGSKIIGDAQASNYEIIPRAWFSRVQNRADFWGALVVDAWAEHTDSRQAIFEKDPIHATLSATFLDHGNMFRGASGDQEFRPYASVFLDRDMYRGEGESEAAERWVKKIRGVGDQLLDQAFAAVPKEWRRSPTERIHERLVGRQQQIEALVIKEVVQLHRRKAHPAAGFVRLWKAASY